MRRGGWAALAAAAVSVYLLADLRLVLSPPKGAPCLPDDEGSWAIGIFRGPSPLNLTPAITGTGASSGNPALTCASVTDEASNFVADPFLLPSPTNPAEIFMFFETKSSATMRGHIGAAVSADAGATWRHAGIALREPWHLSFPHVFMWRGEAYMLPEGANSHVIRLYKAAQLPLQWEEAGVIIERPLVDPAIVEWQGTWYLFASDPSRAGYVRNAALDIFTAASPLGPWEHHPASPAMLGFGAGDGVRMAGRIVKHDGQLYRFGQDCAATYGHRVVAFRIDALTPTEFAQTRVEFESHRPGEGSGAWDSARQHHVDALRLPDGSWLAAVDGDRQRSNPITGPLVRNAVAVGVAWAAAAAAAVAVWRGQSGQEARQQQAKRQDDGGWGGAARRVQAAGRQLLRRGAQAGGRPRLREGPPLSSLA